MILNLKIDKYNKTTLKIILDNTYMYSLSLLQFLF